MFAIRYIAHSPARFGANIRRMRVRRLWADDAPKALARGRRRRNAAKIAANSFDALRVRAAI